MRAEEAKKRAEREASEARDQKAAERAVVVRRREQRMEWRRWGRRALIGPEVDPREEGCVRIAVTLPRTGRVIRRFGRDATVTSLFVFVDAQMIPGELGKEQDPADPPAGGSGGEEVVEAEVEKVTPGNWWGFKLLLTYPRREIKWMPRTRLADVDGLKGGGQVVVEPFEGGLWGEDRDGESEDESDD
jgi:FAS-associated factor 2